MKIWQCKIGESTAVPRGADGPMREAVARAYKELTGEEPVFIFSGWGAELTEPERAVVENRLPTPPADGQAQQENIRAGYPYDDPRFKRLCIEHEIWGTAQSALCAVFWRGSQQDAEKVDALPFQARVQPWMLECFGLAISADREERNHRFLEEALELVQACGCSASEAHQLVDYVFGRLVGEPCQEAGGVMVTLAALCLANNLDMHAAGETELARIWTKVDQIRAKQAAKPKHSPLPVAQPDPATAPQDWIDRMAHLMVDLCMDDDAAAEIMAHARKRVQPASGEDARDAGRYRWLRDITGSFKDGPWVSIGNVFETQGSDFISGKDLDAAIDAAMQQGGQS